MSDHTNIEWTDATWNPITGCSVVSAGCKHCYAMRLAGTRLRHHPSRAGLTRETSAGPVWTGKVRLNEAWLDQPLRWRRPRRIFVCAHGDLFHPAVPVEWIDQVFAVMALAQQHTFQVLTKRPERMRNYLTDHAAGGRHIWVAAQALKMPRGTKPAPGWPIPNVWLGVSVEDQPTADERIPLLLQTPAAVRFVSAEPLLGAVDVSDELQRKCGHCDEPIALCKGGRDIYNGARCCVLCEHDVGIDWVIAGGESGPRARPSHPDWFRILRDQCQAAGVAFFFKQWGAWEVASAANGHFGSRMPVTGERYVWLGSDGRTQTGSSNGLEAAYAAARVGKRAAGRLLDGREWNEFPAVAK
jgi:protein gp37